MSLAKEAGVREALQTLGIVLPDIGGALRQQGTRLVKGFEGLEGLGTPFTRAAEEEAERLAANHRYHRALREQQQSQKGLFPWIANPLAEWRAAPR